MKKFYEKNELMFSIFWIIVYVVGASVFDELSKLVNLEKSLTLAFLFVLSLIFVIWIFKNNLAEKYGLCKPKYTAKNFLYYIPLLVLLTVNFWFGINLQLSVAASIFYVLTMLCVGFVEEIIFRGFLFKAMQKNNLTAAVIVSSLTFGMGHIINLFTSGFANAVPTICQIFYAAATGFLFVIIFYKGKSLLPCIFTHSLFNAFSLIYNSSSVSLLGQILTSLFIIVLTVVYALIIIKFTSSEKANSTEEINTETKNIETKNIETKNVKK